MALLDYSQTHEVYDPEDLSLSDNISSLIEQLSNPDYSSNSILQKPITVIFLLADIFLADSSI